MDDRCATGTNRTGVVSFWNDKNIFLPSLQCSMDDRCTIGTNRTGVVSHWNDITALLSLSQEAQL